MLKLFIFLTFFSTLFILLCNAWIVVTTRSNTYFKVPLLPANETALVLGTSKNTIGGKENLYFKYRMEAAARLYKEGKVKQLILSGNNDSKYYNEPLDMQNALLKLGVPPFAIQLDYAGYRTFDSVVRCKKVFNEKNITIISQDFHTARALYIARKEGIDAIAFAAQDVPVGYSFRTLIREYLARPKAVIDVFVYRPATNLQNKSFE
ncbi:SanA/YdcF family protein [Arundinibacter roseus]|uniref:SanA protein n=1 Tax=Arundinibacter roseus TaxID=2070510 RepID=A0A4R4KA72_9BACT|nr:ElyC/SanA/YdcF family protein [Arundinibacter roseus]TDB64670.1 SanA protein [Arundinibacter roseus]